MSTISSEERSEMRESFLRLLRDKGSEQDVRATMATPSGFDPELWKQLADLGVLGLIVDPEFGGVGGGPEEVEALMEVAGACLLCGPFLISSILAAAIVSSSSDQMLKQEILPGLCSGDLILSVAAANGDGAWSLDDLAVTASFSAGDWQLSGVSSYVVHAQSADLILVLANTPDGAAAFAVAPGTDGLVLSGLRTNDPTLRIARLVLDGARGRRLEGIGTRELLDAMRLAQVGLAGEQAGGARCIFEKTIEYLKTRHQFGRPIGSFQAVKHMAADMLVDVESAISAARQAGRSLAKREAEAPQFIALASFACADAFRDVSAQAIQLHGGIAYTNEHPAHLYWRRARTGLWLFGGSDQHRETYLSLLEAAA
ncbi:MAG: acyl-CoA dehydrogenase [Hyphomonas sp.]|uniref:acyl-CoA dehydrogenase family protein n=1 Tax=Hyphomonas sp. TaxID=87 RepID=UPI0025BF8105|nr:acyl-CoA dehydrogenase family protein [Hyphomonas sp.]MBA4340259.1 acyl-CoA dehydrogenase [Hyphomonas sp.]